MALDPTADAVIRSHQTEWPVKVGSIARDLGIEVLASDMPQGISGALQKDKSTGKWTIRVNRRETKERQRFTVAHEIAHYILHRDIIKDGVSDDALYRSRLSDEVEREANRLAAEILMPWTLVRTAVDQGRKNPDELADLFDVSAPAMYARLGIPA